MWQMANSNKKTLSKNLTQMKFMKRRSQDPTDRLLVDSSAGALIEKWIVPDIPHTDGENLEHGSCHQCVESFVECEGLNQFGRFSFNKFNREVERLAQHYSNGGSKSSTHGSDLLDDDEDGTIPAREMAKRYEEITSRKLLGKRKRSGQLEIRDDNDDVMMTSTSTDDVDDKSEATSSSSKPPPEKKSLRHRELQKRLDKKTEKRGFLKPS